MTDTVKVLITTLHWNEQHCFDNTLLWFGVNWACCFCKHGDDFGKGRARRARMTNADILRATVDCKSRQQVLFKLHCIWRQWVRLSTATDSVKVQVTLVFENEQPCLKSNLCRLGVDWLCCISQYGDDFVKGRARRGSSEQRRLQINTISFVQTGLHLEAVGVAGHVTDCLVVWDTSLIWNEQLGFENTLVRFGVDWLCYPCQHNDGFGKSRTWEARECKAGILNATSDCKLRHVVVEETRLCEQDGRLREWRQTLSPARALEQSATSASSNIRTAFSDYLEFPFRPD